MASGTRPDPAGHAAPSTAGHAPTTVGHAPAFADHAPTSASHASASAGHPPSPAGPPTRAEAVERWRELTATTLPGLAARHRWPIRLDHCFMRVCLDLAIGEPWHRRVARPAIRHLSDSQLAAAIAVAERIVADPAQLPALNHRSLVLRGHRPGPGTDPGFAQPDRDPPP